MTIAIQCKCGETVMVEADPSAGQEIIDTLSKCVTCWKCARSQRQIDFTEFRKPVEAIKSYRQPHND